jgi:hypothetical protein
VNVGMKTLAKELLDLGDDCADEVGPRTGRNLLGNSLQQVLNKSARGGRFNQSNEQQQVAKKEQAQQA